MTDVFAPIVRRHRDEQSPELSAKWPLLRLLDKEFCDQIMVDLVHCGSRWEVHLATESLVVAVPESPGLYLFVWRPYFSFRVADKKKPGDLSQVLYVGKAGAGARGQPNGGNLRSRYRDYLKYLKGDAEALWGPPPDRRTRAKMLERYLKLRPLEYWFLVVEDVANIHRLESHLIKLLNPPCNTQGLPKLVAGFGEPAF